MGLAHDLLVIHFAPEDVPPALKIDWTPWGAPVGLTYAFEPHAPDYSKPLLLIAETSNHGGMVPCEAILERIPAEHRQYALQWNGAGLNGSIWFEEDCAWAAIAIAAPELFDDEALRLAKVIAEAYLDV